MDLMRYAGRIPHGDLDYLDILVKRQTGLRQGPRDPRHSTSRNSNAAERLRASTAMRSRRSGASRRNYSNPEGRNRERAQKIHCVRLGLHRPAWPRPYFQDEFTAGLLESSTAAIIKAETDARSWSRRRSGRPVSSIPPFQALRGQDGGCGRPRENPLVGTIRPEPDFASTANKPRKDGWQTGQGPWGYDGQSPCRKETQFHWLADSRQRRCRSQMTAAVGLRRADVQAVHETPQMDRLSAGAPGRQPVGPGVSACCRASGES